MAQWQGDQSPSHYDSIKLDFYKQRSPKCITTDRGERFQKSPKNNSPSPQSYKAEQVDLAPRVTSVKFGTAKPKNFIDTFKKVAETKPSPATYNIDQCFRSTTLGFSKGYK